MRVSAYLLDCVYHVFTLQSLLVVYVMLQRIQCVTPTALLPLWADCNGLWPSSWPSVYGNEGVCLIACLHPSHLISHPLHSLAVVPAVTPPREYTSSSMFAHTILPHCSVGDVFRQTSPGISLAAPCYCPCPGLEVLYREGPYQEAPGPAAHSASLSPSAHPVWTRW